MTTLNSSITPAVNSSYQSLSWRILVFLVSLVLFEFSVYISNSMVQPCMLHIVNEFHASEAWLASSASAFLLGATLFQVFYGQLTDRFGRRSVMIGGGCIFLLACFAALWVSNIQSFALLRILQGSGMCLIAAVGYVAVQEAFPEKKAVTVIALMTNVALLSPVIGPISGAFLMAFTSWRWVFGLIMILSGVSLWGLYLFMPETLPAARRSSDLSFSKLARDYGTLFRYSFFMQSSFAVATLMLPVFAWSALAPKLILVDQGLSPSNYALIQVPIFLSLIAGNVVLAWKTRVWPLGKSVVVALPFIALGLLLLLISALRQQHTFLIAAMALFTLGQGMSCGILMRFALMESAITKGTVASAISLITLGFYFLGIQISNLVVLRWGLWGFWAIILCSFTAYGILLGPVLRRNMEKRKEQQEDI
ncbi:MAG TPA: MFS transporter [Chitinophaga sp.]|uniref:MFS transporter n=1 Tax=Chitinophaga sp. TaxID=1869181 RepID=UPI002B57D18E|nr:MFS transporter [Chitinophaga sp.]HVI49279.1 MFS transporter [Chitinophaga sp.]